MVLISLFMGSLALVGYKVLDSCLTYQNMNSQMIPFLKKHLLLHYWHPAFPLSLEKLIIKCKHLMVQSKAMFEHMHEYIILERKDFLNASTFRLVYYSSKFSEIKLAYIRQAWLQKGI